MKVKSKLSRKKSSATHATHKTKKTFAETEIKSETHLRRSIRLSERKLHVQFSLPDSDDSENEADEGAAEELLELNNCENDDMCDYNSDTENYNEEMSDCDDDETLENVCDESVTGSQGADIDWSTDTLYLDNLEKTFNKHPNVIGNVGRTEISYFESIFDHQILSHIVTETNRYAKQNNSKNWTDVTEIEMKAFLGCLIVMGIHQLPALKHYWSSDPFLRVDSVAKVMTANRFKKIIENLHCNDNETQAPKSSPNHDKLHKVKPLLDLLNQNVRKVYRPSGVVCVDESMIPFKGRYVLKQYMPKKPVKWGYKVWCLCDSYTG